MTAFNILCAGLIGTLFGVVSLSLAIGCSSSCCRFGASFSAYCLERIPFNGAGLLVDVTGWVVGLVVGAIFAVLSYLFYIAAVGVIAGSLGYFVSVYFLLWVGMKAGFLLWLIGIGGGVILIFVTLQFNLQKWAIIITTALMGAAVSFGTIIQILNPATNLLDNPVKLFLSQSVFLLIVFALMVAAGIVVQYVQNKSFNLDSYNRMETE